MKEEDLQRLASIQSEQFAALAEQRIDDLQALEAEKTALLQALKDVKSLRASEREQLESILKQQHHLETLCADIRDELSERMKSQLQKDKAVKAYEETGF
ncbi:hypothetical protein LH51_14470 [Nitrincola sp. A-D6]|uniref:hypothetical protein n=1 Tax=Nitrincola sp. A-D6 TaxID=1545442 RepID=UPI00051FCA51|nr:hypothetical protein [Nitrincola sp. A-D6]KGK41516.1 hypothetical protein LH51_14470 [Nitrincola sp. A-D6]